MSVSSELLPKQPKAKTFLSSKMSHLPEKMVGLFEKDVNCVIQLEYEKTLHISVRAVQRCPVSV